jgi:hypothetical protein
MPTSYRYYSCADMPKLSVGEELKSETQLALPWGTEQAHSSLRYLGLSEHSDFDRYEAVHQSDSEVDAVYNHEPVRRLVFNLRFPAYYNRKRGYFLVQAGKKESREFFRRLEKADLHAAPGKLDLSEIQNLGSTTGAWFAKLKIAQVSSAAIFGTEAIVESDEWTRYANVGVISALHMHVANEAGVSRAVMVTRDRLVLVMQTGNESDNLDLVEHLNELFEPLEGSA